MLAIIINPSAPRCVVAVRTSHCQPTPSMRSEKNHVMNEEESTHRSSGCRARTHRCTLICFLAQPAVHEDKRGTRERYRNITFFSGSHWCHFTISDGIGNRRARAAVLIIGKRPALPRRRHVGERDRARLPGGREGACSPPPCQRISMFVKGVIFPGWFLLSTI